jgi:hypothetical protein
MEYLPLDWLTVRLHPPGGCGVSTSARKLPTMRVEQLKSREISPVGCKPWLGGFLTYARPTLPFNLSLPQYPQRSAPYE